MLKIYDVALEIVAELVPVIEAIKLKNRDLADQLDRAVVAVPLAIAEGAYVRGGNRNVAYQRGTRRQHAHAQAARACAGSTRPTLRSRARASSATGSRG